MFRLLRTPTQPSNNKRLSLVFSTVTSEYPKRILAKQSKPQIAYNLQLNSPHPTTTRLLKRISLKEKAIGFDYASMENEVKEQMESSEHVVNTSLSLSRLYSEAGRNRQVRINASNYNLFATRANKFWDYLSQSVKFDEKGDLPFSLIEGKMNTLLHFSRQRTPEFLDSVISELEQRKYLNGGDHQNFTNEFYAHLVAKILWCKTFDNGYEMYRKVSELGLLKNDEMKEKFLCEMASHLGEAVGDFTLIINLAKKEYITLSPSIYIAWLEGICSRKADKQRQYKFATKYLLSLPNNIDKIPEVRSTLIKLAMRDGSSYAIDNAFGILNEMIKDKQTPSSPCLNAMLTWCANQRPLRSSLSYTHTHSRLQLIEKSMVAGKVRPSPRILGNLLAGYGQAGDAVSTLGVYRNMKQRGIYLNSSDYSFLFNSISRASIITPEACRLLSDPSKLVEGLLLDMDEVGVPVNQSILNEALRIFTSSLRLSKHLNLRAESFDETRVEFDLIASSANKLYRTMIQGTATNPSVTPNKTTFNNMIKIYCLTGHLERAVKILNRMNQKEIPIDIDIYNKIYEHLSAKDWRLAEDLLTTMTNKSINPNPDTMNAFLKGYTKLDNLNQGFSMVQACFNQYGVKPSKTVFLQALETYLETQDMHEARRVGTIYRQLWPNEEEMLQKFMKGAEQK